jgi:hypothetical protein
MKRIGLMTAVAVFAMAGAGLAFDTSLTYHDQLLAAQAPTLEKDSVLLLGPVSATNGAAVAGTAVNVSTYAGKGLIVAGLGARSAASDTSTVSVVYGYTSSPTNALVTFTQTSATAKYEDYEIDFATLKGTNAALYVKATFTNVEGDATPMIGGAVLVFDKARAALQTVTGSAVATAKYKGFGTLVVSIGAPSLGATNFTGTVRIQSANASTGTWANVSGKTATATGNAAGAVTEIPYEMGAGKPYIRAVFTTTNDVAPVAVTINAFK